jgi:S-adenosylmethionine hydrolase
LIGSGGNLEIAVPNGSAADHLGVGIGDKLRVRRDERRAASGE